MRIDPGFSRHHNLAGGLKDVEEIKREVKEPVLLEEKWEIATVVDSRVACDDALKRVLSDPSA
jgi:hypothetical protein